MSATTHIEWADATWNPLVGCTKVSPGCDNCYAETLVNRFAGHNKGFPNRFDVVTIRGDKALTQPLRWRKPKRIFVNSLSDLFHKDVPDEFIARVFAVMALAGQHTFQLLTKRHARMRSLLNSDDFYGLFGEALYNTEHPIGEEPAEPVSQWPLPNVWLGVSVENQQWADIRVPALLDTPAAIRFLSCEPLLGTVDLTGNLGAANWLQRHGPECSCLGCWNVVRGTVPEPAWWGHSPAIDWVIAGGESGPGARAMHPDWARSLRDQCVAAGAPYLFKQWGNWVETTSHPIHLDHWVGLTGRELVYHSWEERPPAAVRMRNVGKKAAGRELDGRTWDEYPAATPVLTAPTSTSTSGRSQG